MMSEPKTIHNDIEALQPVISTLKSRLGDLDVYRRPQGICGFDGFIDTFIRMEAPASMAEFGPKVAAAAGIAASYTVRHQGDRFGGNGPLFASALHAIHGGEIEVNYIGALGDPEVLPIFQEALGESMAALYSLAEPAHSDCLEFSDGKVMLSDLRSCAEITWDRLLERVGPGRVDQMLRDADFVAAVNWGKLVHVGGIWKGLAARHRELGLPAKELVFFMDLAEFEQRPEADREALIALVSEITGQCHTLLSFNLKEAWQMADSFGGDFHGRKDPDAVVELAALLHANIDADRIVIHPNDGAACATAEGTVYVAGPYCREPLISTGAGDNFGAGCVAAALAGLEDAALLLVGNCASGHYVRSGRPASFADMVRMLDAWSGGNLPERL